MNTAKPAASIPPRPYRDFLTPVLHRRFTRVSFASLVVCYAAAVWIGQWDLFWQWFPVGSAGLRTLLVFLSMLYVYMLRVAQLHIGSRPAASKFAELRQSLLSFNTPQTCLFYGISVLLFCETYILFASPGADLNMVVVGKAYERPRLNERPIYLRISFHLLAVVQTVVHLAYDYDRVVFPQDRTQMPDSSNSIVTFGRRFTQEAIPLGQRSLTRAIIATVATPIVYSLGVRQTAWDWTYWIAKRFATLPKHAQPQHIPYVADILGKSLVESFLLVFLWEFANFAFGHFLAQAPLKKQRPLTDDAKDPNGSLLAGMKAKKEVPRNFAFWELVLIAHHFPARRASIYREIDRQGGATWDQILTVCMGELHAVIKRLQDSQRGPAGVHAQPRGLIQTLPKIASPMRQDNIVSTKGSRPTLSEDVGALAKSYGQSPGAAPLPPRARQLLANSTSALLNKAQQDGLSPSAIKGTLIPYATQFEASLLAMPFRHTASRHAELTVLGPNGTLNTIVDAITAISRLAIYSLAEDSYGRVSKDVATVIRTFAAACDALDPLSSSSDVVNTLLKALRGALTELINEFAEYANDLGLTARELRLAKEAVARGRTPG